MNSTSNATDRERGSAGSWQRLQDASLTEFGQQLWQRSRRDEVLGRSAELAYFFVLSLFPLLLFVTATFGLFVSAESLQQRILDYASRVAPQNALELLSAALEQVRQSASGGKVSTGIVLALWAGSRGLRAAMRALNVAYGIRDDRSWLRGRLTAVALTLALSAFSFVALIVLLFGQQFVAAAAAQWGDGIRVLWSIARWVLPFVLAWSALEMVYFWGPHRPAREWHGPTPGALLAVLLWVGASLLLKWYLMYFGALGATYGTLGALIALLLWFYLAGAALLIGGEVNALSATGVRSPHDRHNPNAEPA